MDRFNRPTGYALEAMPDAAMQRLEERIESSWPETWVEMLRAAFTGLRVSLASQHVSTDLLVTGAIGSMEAVSDLLGGSVIYIPVSGSCYRRGACAGERRRLVAHSAAAKLQRDFDLKRRRNRSLAVANSDMECLDELLDPELLHQSKLLAQAAFAGLLRVLRDEDLPVDLQAKGAIGVMEAVSEHLGGRPYYVPLNPVPVSSRKTAILNALKTESFSEVALRFDVTERRVRQIEEQHRLNNETGQTRQAVIEALKKSPAAEVAARFKLREARVLKIYAAHLATQRAAARRAASTDGIALMVGELEAVTNASPTRRKASQSVPGRRGGLPWPPTTKERQ
ncbi:hypothetical protein CLD22_25730 [Rubrivivax gelatinosus]|nr:hypothetical protein [Rubrivivax gelatinosus]